MKEFDYDLDYKRLDFTDEETRKHIVLEEGARVLLVRPYTNDICAHWRFKTPKIVRCLHTLSLTCI